MHEKQELFSKIDNSTTFRNICDLFSLRKKAVLDIGCGHGHYLRHFGEGSFGVTTAQEEVEFGKKNSLNIVFGNAEYLEDSVSGKQFDAFWANNLFEHLLSPHAFLMKLKRIAHKDSVLVLGVPVVPKIVWFIQLRWFRGVLASNHINFFTGDTLKLTVERAGFKVLFVRPFLFKNAFFDNLAKPFAPHLYVVAQNDTHFVYPPKKVGEWKDDVRYKELLSITGQNET
jgi:SAM-dependent methyltransferase